MELRSTRQIELRSSEKMKPFATKEMKLLPCKKRKLRSSNVIQNTASEIFFLGLPYELHLPVYEAVLGSDFKLPINLRSWDRKKWPHRTATTNLPLWPVCCEPVRGSTQKHFLCYRSHTLNSMGMSSSRLDMSLMNDNVLKKLINIHFRLQCFRISCVPVLCPFARRHATSPRDWLHLEIRERQAYQHQNPDPPQYWWVPHFMYTLRRGRRR